MRGQWNVILVLREVVVSIGRGNQELPTEAVLHSLFLFQTHTQAHTHTHRRSDALWLLHTSLVRPASSLVAIPQACQRSPSPGIKTYIHLQESNSNPNPTLDTSSPPPPFKHLGHFTSIKHPFHKGDEARSAGGEPAFQGEQKPNRGNHLGKLLCCCSVAQSCLDSLQPHGLQHARLPCP